MNEVNSQAAADRIEKNRGIAEFCKKCAEDKIAENTIIIPLGNHSTIADFFVIATANSEPHLQALSSYLERQVREHYQLRNYAANSDNNGGWVLLDFGDVIVHLMLAETRARYDLESLWAGKKSAE